MVKMASARKIILNDIDAGKTAFFLCDMQERFRPAIKYFSDIVEVAKRLVSASKILDIPLVVTEQYPKGLGNTVPELDISHGEVFPKTKFSMVIPEVKHHLAQLCDGNVEHVVLFGIEAHVCVQQTVIDLLKMHKQVHVIADGCSSRSQMDRMFAYDRFQSYEGAVLTTSEAVLLQLIGDKNHPNFKEIQGLIKVSSPTSGLVPPDSQL